MLLFPVKIYPFVIFHRAKRLVVLQSKSIKVAFNSNRFRFYSKGALTYIVPILMQSLAKQEEYDDEDDWNPSKAAGVCLMLLANCTCNDIVQHVLPFVQVSEAKTPSPSNAKEHLLASATRSIDVIKLLIFKS